MFELAALVMIAAALALGMSDRTVRRDWIKARAWLRLDLEGDADIAAVPSRAVDRDAAR